MGAKIDTTGIEFLEGDFGVGRRPTHVTKRKAVKQPLKVAKTRHDPFQGVSSGRLVRELTKRHYVDLQVLGFWLAIALIIWIKLG